MINRNQKKILSNIDLKFGQNPTIFIKTILHFIITAFMILKKYLKKVDWKSSILTKRIIRKNKIIEYIFSSPFQNISFSFLFEIMNRKFHVFNKKISKNIKKKIFFLIFRSISYITSNACF